MRHTTIYDFIRRSIMVSIIGYLVLFGIHSANLAHGQTPSNTPQRPIIYPVTYDEVNQKAAGHADRIPVGEIANQPVPPTITALNWTFLGPQPIEDEYWSGYDDASGRISSIIVDPTNTDIVYLAGAQGGVWKSTDGGTNWTPKTDYLSSLASGALAFDPVDSDIIYYGTGELHYSVDCQYGDGLFKTTDAGETWTKIAEKATIGSYVSKIIVNPQNRNIIYLGGDFGCLRSTDSGDSWTNYLDQSHCNDLACSPADPSVVFAALHSYGIYRSTDYGVTWNLLDNGLPSGGFARINMAISESDANVLYASFIAFNGSLYGMYKTTDAGTNWSLLPNTPNYVRYQGWYDNCVIVDRIDPDICFAGGAFPYGGDTDYGLIMTTDGGNSWVDINIGQNGQVHPDHHCLAMGPDRVLWVGCDGGIWKTSDHGTNWINCNHTLGISQFYTMAIHPTNADFLLGGTQDNGTARYAGLLGWPQLSAGDGGPCAVEWDSPNIYYSTYVQMYNLTKWDDGDYVEDITGPWAGDRASWCNGALAIDPNQPNTMLAGTYRVFRTTDSGGSWDQLSGDLTNGGVLRSLAVAIGYSNTVYSGSSDGRVFVTTNGSTWNDRSTGLPGAPIPSLNINPANRQNLYICADRSSGSRVFSTTDGGLNWTSNTGDLPSGLRGKSLATDFSSNPPGLYLGTDYGVYTSTDDGTTWVKDSANLPNIEIYDMRIDSYNDILTVATHGRGMFRSPLAGAQEIPTLSEWAMVILGLLMLAIATVVLIRTRRTTAYGSL